MPQITELARQLGDALLSVNAQVSTAESCTGGGIAEAITRIAGSSTWFEAGYVTYSNAQKTKMLQVPAGLFVSHGAVSLPVVEAMAQGAQHQSGAHYAVAVSGIAGPDGGTADKPVGTVCFAWAAGDRVVSSCVLLSGDRQTIRRQTVERALSGLIALVQGEKLA